MANFTIVSFRVLLFCFILVGLFFCFFLVVCILHKHLTYIASDIFLLGMKQWIFDSVYVEPYPNHHKFPYRTIYHLVQIGGNAMYVVITPSAASLTYNDGSTPNVIRDKIGVLTSLVNTTPTDATHFLLDAIEPFGVGFGLNNREASWNSMVVNTLPALGGVTGTIFYKKDFITNTLHIKASLAANNAQNFSGAPVALFSLMGTLPAAYIPMTNVYFIANYFVSGLIKDDLGIAWIKQVNCAINTGGQVLINWLKPDSLISAYGINFNTIVPID